jgi:hypothetical protein
LSVCLSVCNRVKRTLPARRQTVITFDAVRGNSMWGTRIWGPLASKPHWSTRNQWKSSFLETRYAGVSRCEKRESEVRWPRKPIGRPGTNGNRVLWKHVFQRYHETGKMNPAPKHLGNPLFDQEPMETEFPEKNSSLFLIESITAVPYSLLV